MKHTLNTFHQKPALRRTAASSLRLAAVRSALGALLATLIVALPALAQPKPKVRPRPRPKAPAAAPAQAQAPAPAAPTDLPPGTETVERPYRPLPAGARVTFNLEDAELMDLVKLISEMTGRRFIVSSKARSLNATVLAPTKVTVAEAYEAFLSVLQANGLTVVPAGRYLKIVETAGIEGQPIGTFLPGQRTPGGDRFITRLQPLSHVSADDVAQLLGRFKSREGNIVAYAPSNMVIMTDTGTAINRMLRILEAIDTPRSGEQVWIEPVNYANATELVQRIQEVFPVGDAAAGKGGAPPPPRPPVPPPGEGGAPGAVETVGGQTGAGFRITKLLADERTNSIIMLATEPAYRKVLDLVRELDVALEGEGRVHVHHLQHSDAEKMAETLTALIGNRGGGARRAGAPGAPPAQGNASDVFEGEIAITAHKATNSLIITSSLHDYVALRKVLERLDVERRQVFIEAVIMELSVRRSNELGISFHGGLPNQPSDGSLAVLGFNAGRSINPVNQDSLTGLALGLRGPNIPESQQLVGLSIPAFGVVLNAIAQTGDANVLSTPHLLAMDNVQAEINVGENVPLQTSGVPLGLGALGLGGLGATGAQGAGANAAAGLAGLGAGFAGAVPRQDVGTKIQITPHVNDNDEIRLEIQQEISARVPQAEGTLGVVSLTKRNAKTELVVRDQQTVVIGGLMRDELRRTESKIPILGDIPLLGVLFRRTTRATEKTNLILFLTPYVVRSPEDLRAIYERKMRERQEFIDRYFVFGGDHDYRPAIDYGRTRGIIGEMLRSVHEQQEEERIQNELLSSQIDRGHTPKNPVGFRPAATPAPVVEPIGDAAATEAPAAPPDGNLGATPTVEAPAPPAAPPATPPSTVPNAPATTAAPPPVPSEDVPPAPLPAPPR